MGVQGIETGLSKAEVHKGISKKVSSGHATNDGLRVVTPANGSSTQVCCACPLQVLRSLRH